MELLFISFFPSFFLCCFFCLFVLPISASTSHLLPSHPLPSHPTPPFGSPGPPRLRPIRRAMARFGAQSDCHPAAGRWRCHRGRSPPPPSPRTRNSSRLLNFTRRVDLLTPFPSGDCRFRSNATQIPSNFHNNSVRWAGTCREPSASLPPCLLSMEGKKKWYQTGAFRSDRRTRFDGPGHDVIRANEAPARSSYADDGSSWDNFSLLSFFLFFHLPFSLFPC